MMLTRDVPTDVGRVDIFSADPGFGFEVHLLSKPADGNPFYVSELRVTAARELNNVTVECDGFDGRFTSTIHIALVGK